MLLAGCSDGGPSGTGGSAASAPPAKGTVDVVRTVATKLRSPWGLAALPGGDLLVGSRDSGKIVQIAARDGRQSELGTVPGVSHTEEGGLLGLALSPGYADDHLLYAYFTTDSDNRIARMRVDERQPEGRRLGAPDTILRGIPKGVIHNGGRITFGPDRMLYAGTGESGRRALSEDKSSLGGKILRMTPDGRPAPGNPEAGSVIYTFGHRNVQGLAWDTDKRLWASEFGQDTWDEINLIEPGHDYGWPVVEGKAGRPGYTDPVEQWRPADASPSGLAYAKGSLWMAGLRGRRLWRIPVAGGKPAGAPQDFLHSRYGRLRSVLATDDGGLWLTTSNTDGRGEPSRDDDRLLLLKVT
nr:PQQ-dependent sugar dehydrogenase [Streptomyces olivoverticillatus]